MSALLRLKLTAIGFLAANAYANQSSDVTSPYQVTGSYQVVIHTNPVTQGMDTRSYSAEELSGIKVVSLMQIEPSAALYQKALEKSLEIDMRATENDYSSGIVPFASSAGSKDLGMNDVPVLDQGSYGTCVTFSTTAALDTLIGKGDFIDQQCLLALMNYQGHNYWNGALYSSQMIEPLKANGVVKKGTCNVKYPSPSSKLSPTEYKKYVDASVSVKDVKYTYTKGLALAKIKEAINAGHRVSIGTLLIGNSDPVSVQGFDITVNGVKSRGGLWACKQKTSTKNYCGPSNAGHEIVVMGYDDKQKLLKIRNSWNTKVGDKGDFYMTYEFFDAMSIDGTVISL